MRPLFVVKYLVIWTMANLAMGSVCAQWPVFRVYHSSGPVKYQAAGQSAAQLLHDRVYLYKGDKLLLNEVCDITLFDQDTNYIRLRGIGIYTTADILKMQKVHIKDNITIRYCALLWEDLFKPGQGAGLRKEVISHAAGGVSRGLTLVLAPADGYRTSMDRQLFRWHKVNFARAYRLQLADEGGRVCYSILVADTQVNVRLADSLVYGKYYTWTLGLIGGGDRIQIGDSGRIGLVNESKTIPAISQMPVETADLGGIAHELQQCGIYEDSGCTKTAYGIYQQLLKKYPDDPALKKLYHAFLDRNYIDDYFPSTKN